MNEKFRKLPSIIVCFLFMSGVSPCSAQRLLPNPESDAQMRMLLQRQQDQKNMKSSSFFNEDYGNNDRHWRVVAAMTETQYLMVRKDRKEWYFGETKDSGKGRAFCHGYGIIKFSENEYCLCQWKRDSRHGKGIMRKEDGTVVTCDWRWDTIVKDSIRSASDEEISELQKEIKRLEKLISMVPLK